MNFPYLCVFVLFAAVAKYCQGSEAQCNSRGGRCIPLGTSCSGETDYVFCDFFYKCCIDGLTVPTTRTTTRTTPTPETTSGTGRTTGRPASSTTTQAPGLSCGKRPGGVSSRIVGGGEATAHTWPWQLSLQKNYYGTYYHICGAILIGAEWALTAAHCVDGDSASQFVVYAGLHNQAQKSTATRASVSRIFQHEGYSGSSAGFPNDIALLRLSTSVAESDKIAYVCLPHETQDFLPAHSCYITGWGDTKGTQNKNLLQELDIDVTPNPECTNMWGSNYIRDTHICVGTGLKGACNGDSGGPLHCEYNGNWYIAGATSWGRTGCKTQGYPSVYTRISKFVTWITDKQAAFSQYS